MSRVRAEDRQNYPSVAVRVNPSTVVEILIHPSLTGDELRFCLVQVLSHGSKSKLLLDDQICGLYRESDGRFLPLTHVLHEPDAFFEEVLCLENPQLENVPDTTHECKSGASNIRRFVTLLRRVLDFASDQPTVFCASVPVIAFLSYFLVSVLQSIILFFTGVTCRKALNLLSILWDILMFLHTMLVDTPIKEIYRYGPPYIGWEGVSLFKICAESTHYGDEDFWSKNGLECNEIFSSKEHAALILFRPIVYFLVMGFIYLFRKIFPKKKEESIDPNMVETFEALNNLVKQLRRSFDSVSK